MIYVVDTSVISTLHRNFYPKRFPSLWKRLDSMLADGRFTSAREAFRELEDKGGDELSWANANSGLFLAPDAKEGALVAQIYAVKHFQANIEKQKMLKGGKCADPFLIARAQSIDGTVLTMEQYRPHSAKIPNICEHFKVPCVDLEKFMENEGWEF